ncbi:LysM peptidoglycan-binding domain-containing protein [Adhaeribacter rhizoryzae]|uniref:LysM peptidoglycan-binding domain-containing protein n=1 Tax=Adhaeribacter rhizoryzae TaxID=2607907 RepID=A0A5M6DM93_9BACT|nr:LysM peptidoglycan-binding domain-containing protein [Adhaeribacter rhizoryzae]KAA5548667.1 LysM peptidoglycan-binding domain-containing protein [Adhaeribacter rhizoryzae]
MRKGTILFLLSCISLLTNAQNIIVPSDIYFADQHLRVNNRGQQEIQRQVDALTKYPTYFQAKVDRADTYFPIIERIFREEGLPDDFKYLALQESGLVSDAVSTSNAVGFWQFKKEAASDQKLQINQEVDERKHIIESTRSAARYLVKHNNVYYKNWHNTLLSYNLGLTGAKGYAKPNDFNKKEMEVTERTHPYILTFLAHKVAFSNYVGRNPAPGILLQEMTASAGKSFREIAMETQTDEAELQKYNKWLHGRAIPYDKTYTILIPVTNPDQQSVIYASNRTGNRNSVVEQTGKREFRKQNNLKVIIARTGDTKDKLAAEADMPARRFLMYNDMYSFDPIVPGEAYYLETKHSKADVPYHVVKQGETIHQVAQQHGVKVRSLLFYNRLKATETLAEGRLLWMQRRRPANTPVEFQKTYPDNAPAPAQPGILAQNDDPAKANTENKSADSNRDEEKSIASALEKRLNKWFGVKKKPAKVQEVEVPATPEPVAEPQVATRPAPAATPTAETSNNEAATTIATPGPAEPSLDEAIAQTNEEADETGDSLSANIDKQIEPVNKPTVPLVYSRTKTPAPVAETTSPANNTPMAADSNATTETTAVETPATKPAVRLKEPVAAAPTKTTASTSIYKEPAKAPAQPVQNPGVHVVAKGETLYAISRMYQVSLEDLKTWNNLGEMPLAIGQNLKLVAPPVTSTSYSTVPVNKPQAQAAAAPIASNSSYANGPVSHTVSAGESMYQISRRYGVTIKEIMEWNNKPDFNVKPGERLVIKTAAATRN